MSSGAKTGTLRFSDAAQTGELNFSRRITVAESQLVRRIVTLRNVASSMTDDSTGQFPVMISSLIGR